MRAYLQELSLVALVVILVSLFVLVHLNHEDVREIKLLDNESTDLGTDTLNTRETPNNEIVKSKKQGEPNNRKDSVGNQAKVTVGRIEVVESIDFGITDVFAEEPEDEVADILAGLGVDEEEINDVVVAMFDAQENDGIQEETWDVGEAFAGAQLESRETVMADLYESGISMEEIHMVLETLFPDSEDESLEDGFGLKENEFGMINDKPEKEFLTPLDESNFSNEMMKDLIEAISREDVGYETEEDVPMEDTELMSLPAEDAEAIINDFHNFDLSMEEIDSILED